MGYKIGNYRLTHNGMKVEFFSSKRDCDVYIHEVLIHYNHLSPKKIYDREITTTNGKSRLVVYEYSTLYREMFMIEENN